MKNKVKVSHEVAEALKDLLSRSGSVYSKEWILQTHYEAIKDGDKWSGDRWQHLNKLTMTEMAQAMFVGYEVDPRFEIGDWVVRVDGKVFNSGFIAAIVTEVNKHRLNLEGQEGSFTCEFVRHATPKEIKAEKERQLWKKLGREVGEFREGDVRLVDGYSSVYTSATGAAKNDYNNGELTGLYPVESFISFEELK